MPTKKSFDLDAYAAKDPAPPFTFTFRGRDWELPSMQELDAWHLLDAAGKGDQQATLEVIRLAFGDSYDEFRATGPIPQRVLNGLFEQYMKHSGIQPGESAASTSS